MNVKRYDHDSDSSPNSPCILDDTSGHLLSSERGTDDDDDTADNHSENDDSDDDDDDSDGIPSVRTGT